MANIALNKSADASNYVYPYVPSKAVDGGSTPLGRWLGSSPIPVSGTPSPVWLRVDLGAFSWINRWVVKQMGSVGWNANYNLTDYKLQGSIDNANWFDIDSVTNNSANQTDRAFTPTKVRWARIYVTKGLRCNTNFASIVDLELYPADPTSAKLTSLVLSAGTLAPPFASAIYSYTANVGYDNSSITVTPTAEDSRATIKVNGTPVTSGQASEVSLQVGENTVIVQVTPFIGDPQNYTITVTRASSPYLTKVEVKYQGRGGQQTLTINIDKNNTQYNADVPTGTTQVTITPYAEDQNATILVNNDQNVPSGQTSSQITVNTTTGTSIPIKVTSSTGVDSKDYIINII
jgi:hypothetical protein